MAFSGLAEFQNSYEISPIILVGGIAGSMTGGMLPIISLLDNSGQGIVLEAGGDSTPLGRSFARFTVVAGGTLIENEVATWPLANQAVAANDVITQPLRIALRMTAPAQPDGINYTNKRSVMTNLQAQLSAHIAQGGWFNIATPSFIYTGCLLTALRDITDLEGGAQVQVEWAWEFLQPLITASAASAAQNTAMGKITSGTQIAGDPPLVNDAANATGNPASGLASTTIPAAAGAVASSAVPSNFNASSIPDVSAVSPIAPGTSGVPF